MGIQIGAGCLYGRLEIVFLQVVTSDEQENDKIVWECLLEIIDVALCQGTIGGFCSDDESCQKKVRF